MTNRSRFALALTAIAGGLVSASNADVIATLTYDSLSGSWDNASGLFTAIAVDQGPNGLRSAGEASRIIATENSASFNSGFTSRTTASYSISLTATATANPNEKDGVGSFTATDINGDTITGNIVGTWLNLGNGFVVFNGGVANAFFNNNSGDGEFNGETGSFFDMIFATGQGPYEGAAANLVFNAGSFFTTNFDKVTTGSLIQIVPTPGALALMGMGGLVAIRRRR
jgi:hypothetical protein